MIFNLLSVFMPLQLAISSMVRKQPMQTPLSVLHIPTQGDVFEGTLTYTTPVPYTASIVEGGLDVML